MPTLGKICIATVVILCFGGLVTGPASRVLGPVLSDVDYSLVEDDVVVSEPADYYVEDDATVRLATEEANIGEL